MPVMSRTGLALLAVGSALTGGLVSQHMIEQQTAEQTLLAAKQLVRESQIKLQPAASGHVGGWGLRVCPSLPAHCTVPCLDTAETCVCVPDVNNSL